MVEEILEEYHREVEDQMKGIGHQVTNTVCAHHARAKNLALVLNTTGSLGVVT